MRYQVLMTDPASADLDAICQFIAESGSLANAERILDRMTSIIATLAKFPERGSHPREMLALGISDFRQVVSNPWRVLYRIIGQRVYIVLIADGRRDMRGLLAQRLLSGTAG